MLFISYFFVRRPKRLDFPDCGGPWIHLKKEDKIISISGVTQAKGMGTTGSKQGLKGDVTLVTANGEQNLSVKKDGIRAHLIFI